MPTPDASRERMDALYGFLLSQGNRWTGMERTAASVPGYPLYEGNDFHNSRTRRILTADIEAVNESPYYRCIIIHGNRGIKLATQREFERFVRAETAEVFRKLARVRNIIKKGHLDQQADLEGEIREAFLGGQ